MYLDAHFVMKLKIGNIYNIYCVQYDEYCIVFLLQILHTFDWWLLECSLSVVMLFCVFRAEKGSGGMQKKEENQTNDLSIKTRFRGHI